MTKAEQILDSHKTGHNFFYQFNQTIHQLYSAGFTVVAITSDMGSGNMSLWSELNIGYQKDCYFKHPSNDLLQIFVFADIPHLLKLLRNHFLDQGFIYKNKIINKECVDTLLSGSASELTIAFKINSYHLNLKGTERQKVQPAAQLFSNQVAKSIEWCGKKGFMENKNWKETAELIKLTNDWFDLFNSRSKFGDHFGTNAFGVNLDSQIELLQNFSDMIESIRVGTHKGLIQFQKGILLSNISLLNLFYYLKDKYSVEYILTYRLNQDILENFFSYIRGMGGRDDHPTPLEFKHRLRWYILGKHSASVFSINRNSKENVHEQCLVTPMETENLKISDSDICLSHSAFKHFAKDISEQIEDEPNDIAPYTFIEHDDLINIELDTTYFEISDEHLNLLDQFEQFNQDNFVETLTFEGLKYIAGYVAYRFKHKYDHLGIPTKELPTHELPDWIQFISRGQLLVPSETLISAAKIMEIEFQNLHGNWLSNAKLLFDLLTDRTIANLPENAHIPYEVLHCLARTRTYIRMRDLNKKISFNNCQRKLKRKMSKFVNRKI